MKLHYWVKAVMRNGHPLFESGLFEAVAQLLLRPQFDCLLAIFAVCVCVCGTVPQGSPSSIPLTSELLWSSSSQTWGVGHKDKGWLGEGVERKCLSFVFPELFLLVVGLILLEWRHSLLTLWDDNIPFVLLSACWLERTVLRIYSTGQSGVQVASLCQFINNGRGQWGIRAGVCACEGEGKKNSWSSCSGQHTLHTKPSAVLTWENYHTRSYSCFSKHTSHRLSN